VNNLKWYEGEVYFEKIPKEFCWFAEFPVFEWNEKIPQFLKHSFANFKISQNLEALENCARVGSELYFHRSTKIQKEVFIAPLSIYLSKAVTIEAGATIHPFCYLSENVEIRQSAYLRNNTLVGASCVIGHCTETKNSLIFEHSELGHFNYVGDSVIGSYCNLGAGSILCNLPFRSKEQKQKQEFPLFQLSAQGKKISAAKKGVVLGDASEVGCNSTLGPMSFFGKQSVVYPNLYISKGVFPPKSRFRKPQDYQSLNLADS
jgi:NDP-sugar pyrophosphorylase family protein